MSDISWVDTLQFVMIAGAYVLIWQGSRFLRP